MAVKVHSSGGSAGRNIVNAARAAGLELTLEPGALHRRGPVEVVRRFDPLLLEHMAEVVDALRQEPVTTELRDELVRRCVRRLAEGYEAGLLDLICEDLALRARFYAAEDAIAAATTQGELVDAIAAYEAVFSDAKALRRQRKEVA